MTFEEVLAFLLGAVGGPVSIAITPAEGPSPLIATVAGCLVAGAELTEDGSFFFYVEDGGSGFVLSRETFRGATADADSLVVARVGPVALWIDRDP